MTEAVERLAEAIFTLAHGKCCWEPDEDAQAILATDPALAAAIELGLRLANRITPEALASVYATDALFVARLCDEYLDRSGGLLGRVRLAARLREPKP